MDAYACEAGMDLYRAVYAEQSDLRKRRGKRPIAGKIRIPWTPLSYVWLSLSGFGRWLFTVRLAPMPYIGGAHLGGADLGGAKLRGAYLEGADLSGANLGDWERGPDGYAQRKVGT